jgi:hypothetical protein
MEHPEEEVDDGLVALSHGPHLGVWFCYIAHLHDYVNTVCKNY